MDEPPFMVDGARVLAYALLDAPSMGSRRATAFAAGVPLDSVRGLMIAENLADGAVFLLFCTEEWQTLAAEQQADVDSAEKAARAAYPDAALERYRALSAAEQAEVETTRTFLRDLARDFPA